MAFLSRTRLAQAHSDAIWGVAWSPLGLLTCSIDETVTFWDTSRMTGDQEPVPIQKFKDHTLAVISVALSPDGSFASSSSMDGSICVYDLNAKSQIRKIDAGPMNAWTVAMTDKLVATGAHNGQVKLWAFSSGSVVDSNISLTNPFTMAVKFNATGTVLAAGGNKGEVAIFDPSTSKLVQKMSGHTKGIRSMSFAGSDGNVLLTGSEDQTIGIFDVRGGQQVASLAGHNSWVLDVASQPNSSNCTERFASCSSDKTVKVWEMRTREAVHCFESIHTEKITGIAFSPAGDQLASVSDDASIQFYTVPNK
jgi:WD repeat-containing protein 61